MALTSQYPALFFSIDRLEFHLDFIAYSGCYVYIYLQQDVNFFEMACSDKTVKITFY